MAQEELPVNVFELHEKWYWKQRDENLSVLEEVDLPVNNDFVQGWTDAQTWPSEIHVELLKVGKIPHPYIGFNEHEVQWIGDVEWLYKNSFPFDTKLRTGEAILEFQGLDTVCDVYLNGTKIISAKNMFQTYSYEIDLSSPQNPFQDRNTLLLHFKSAKRLAKTEEEKYGKVRAGSTNLGDPSRVYVRKAQYDWRWDWGPELMTCGPYRSITLTTFTSRIKDVYARASLALNPNNTLKPSLKVDVALNASVDPATHFLRIQLKDLQGNKIKSRVVHLVESVTGMENLLNDAIVWQNLDEEGVELWWPVGYGKQIMYDLEVALFDGNGQTLDKQVKRIGFRSVKLVQEDLKQPDQYGSGTSFLFEVNGIRMFIGGSNWVPADNFITTITPDRYRRWLQLLRDGNQNMVRIWGGGIYEPDVFYDICDELGILVWQDFQFACGVYPAHDDFVASVKDEAAQNVRRLRHHPSIALFCGNNEDYQQVLQWGGIGELPARKLYEHVLPDVVQALTDPAIPYHRGSPYGGKDWDTSDPTVGDVHQWNIWGGKELPYQDYEKLGGRFVSEFGIPSMPSMRTIKYWMGDASKSQWHAQSKLIAQHTRAGSFERRFAILMNENFRLTEDLETHVYRTQLLQSEAVSYAYQIWRREWRGKGKEYNAGVIVWQLNDCWPVTSWAIVDYFLRPKPAYYTIARQLAEVTVNISRTVVKNRDNDRPRQFYEFGAFQSKEATLDIWATNRTLVSVKALLELRFFDLNDPSWVHKISQEVELLPNQSTELTKLPCPSPPRQGIDHPSSSVVASARLLELGNGNVLARYSDWPQPYKFLEIPDPGLRVRVEHDRQSGTGSLHIDVQQPVKGLFFSVKGLDDDSDSDVRWSDNMLDVVPGDSQVIFVTGLQDRKVAVAYLGKEGASDVLDWQ